MSEVIYTTTCVACDQCGDEFDIGPGESFYNVRRAAQAEGWTIEGNADVCPNHKDRGTA